MTDNGIFHWNELMTSDPDGAKDYYSATVGWTFEAMPMDQGGTYWICMAGEKPCGGIMSLEGMAPEGTLPHWVSYLAVDDLESRLETAKRLGGTVLREPFEVAGIGKIAMVQDPHGAQMGWITPASQS